MHYVLFQIMDREGYFVEPTIVTGLPHDSPLVKTECFAPIVYCIEIPDLNTGIKYNNEVEQGLSSSLFTENLGDVFKVRAFLIALKSLTISIRMFFPVG